MTGWYLPSSGRVETCLTLGAVRRGWYLQQGTSPTRLKVMDGLGCRAAALITPQTRVG